MMEQNTFSKTDSKNQSFLVNNPALNGMNLPKMESVGSNDYGKNSNVEENNQNFITNNSALNATDLPPLEPVGPIDDYSTGGRHR